MGNILLLNLYIDTDHAYKDFLGKRIALSLKSYFKQLAAKYRYINHEENPLF